MKMRPLTSLFLHFLIVLVGLDAPAGCKPRSHTMAEFFGNSIAYLR